MSTTEGENPADLMAAFPRCIYVKRLPKEASDEQIITFFQGCGKIERIDMKLMLKGKFAFITFDSEAAVELALAKNGVMFGDEALIIERRNGKPPATKSPEKEKKKPRSSTEEKQGAAEPPAATASSNTEEAEKQQKQNGEQSKSAKKKAKKGGNSGSDSAAGAKDGAAGSGNTQAGSASGSGEALPPPYSAPQLPSYNPAAMPFWPGMSAGYPMPPPPPPPPPPMLGIPPPPFGSAPGAFGLRYYGMTNASQTKDATKYADPTQRLPVLLIYGAACSGCTTVAKQLAHDQNLVFFSAQSAAKDSLPWIHMSNILTKLQQTMSTVPQPILGLVIDWTPKNKSELGFLLHWLEGHSIPLTAAFKVDDKGAALPRALQTAETEPEYQDYLRIKFERGNAALAELEEYFSQSKASYKFENPPGATPEESVRAFKPTLALAKANRALSHTTIPVPTLTKTTYLRAILDADEYLNVMNDLWSLVGSGVKRGPIPVPSAEGVEKVSQRDWYEEYLLKPAGAGGPALPVARAQLGTPGLLFYHCPEGLPAQKRKLYFVPKGSQHVIFSLPSSYWRFGSVVSHCVLLASNFLDAATQRHYLFIEDALVWEGNSLFGRRFEARLAILEKGMHSVTTHRPFTSLNFATFTDSSEFSSQPDRLFAVIHKPTSLQQLGSLAKKGGKDFEELCASNPLYGWCRANNEPVLVFDAAAPTSLHSHTATAFRGAKGLTFVLRLGKVVASNEASVTHELEAYQTSTATSFSEKGAGETPVRRGETCPLSLNPNTVVVPATLKTSDPDVCHFAEVYLNESGSWTFVQLRTDRVNPDNLIVIQKTGVFAADRILNFDSWLSVLAERCHSLPSYAVQSLLETIPAAPKDTPPRRGKAGSRTGKEAAPRADSSREGKGKGTSGGSSSGRGDGRKKATDGKGSTPQSEEKKGGRRK